MKVQTDPLPLPTQPEAQTPTPDPAQTLQSAPFDTLKANFDEVHSRLQVCYTKRDQIAEEIATLETMHANAAVALREAVNALTSVPGVEPPPKPRKIRSDRGTKKPAGEAENK